MKLGLSLFLRENVPAKSLGHGDCAEFQVVCPCCREPVFKVERQRHPETSHYLSHYAATQSDVQDCENRVGSITDAMVTDQARVGRNQRLELFLRVLREEIDRANRIPRVLELRRDALRSKALASMFDRLQAETRRKLPGLEAEFDEIFDERMQELTSVDGMRDLSPFARGIRKRTTLELYKHLHTPPALPNYRFLAMHATGVAMDRIERKIMGKHPSLVTCEVEVLGMLNMVLRANRKGGERILAGGMETASTRIPQDPSYGMSVTGTAISWIAGDMIGALVEIDYVEVLRRRLGVDASEAARRDLQEVQGRPEA